MAKRLHRSRTESEAHWRRLIREQQQSGQTIVGFCRDRELTASAFHFWKRELRDRQRKRELNATPSQPADKQRARDESTPTFVPVSVAPEAVVSAAVVSEAVSRPTNGPITLELDGATLRIEAGVDGALLRTVLDALRAG